MAWRQTHDQPQHQFGLDGPFSFCSYPFLLNPRAKSKLLHTEARFLMTQVTTTPHHTSPHHIMAAFLMLTHDVLACSAECMGSSSEACSSCNV